MFAGHLGAALALGRAERRLNVGVLVGAALLLDAVLWLLILGGWESVRIPADFASTHQPEFSFPLSHGLAAAFGWSALAAVLALWALARRGLPGLRAAALVAAAVFSHWLLDALVHRPELPLLGSASPAVGLGLWDDMPVALAAEAIIVVLGLTLFLVNGAVTRARAIGITALTAIVLVFTAAGMTVTPAPPSAVAMAVGSLATIAGVTVLYAWLGTRHGHHS